MGLCHMIVSAVLPIREKTMGSGLVIGDWSMGTLPSAGLVTIPFDGNWQLAAGPNN